MTDTALAKVDNDSTPFWLMDRLDDELIKAELEGKLPDVLTYHFQDGGKEIWGLSKAGVDEAKAELAKKGEVLRVLDVQFIDGDKDGKFIVKVGRYAISSTGQEVLLDTTAGFKKQEKNTLTGKENKFWFEQGGVKAQRNAFHSLIPKTIIQGVIEYAKKSGKVKEVKHEPKPEPKPDQPEKFEGNKSVYSATDKQKKMIFAQLKSIGISNVDDMKNFALEKCGKPSSKDWTNVDIQTLVEAIDETEPDRLAGEGDD
ncbi:MAG TPA: hypothetical protein DCY12_08845 [Candidatus Atribacteria bacterium]|nr:hypothetical protein [Candidatus Atribacteria bacterium]